ncbi:keratinocyte-associated protein 3 [Thalassophryne amazonica]|uniref:keratinocyte-associated protein 3 n=1 Tax=Thalassophryne amazonica TaxID=390379 RepID=UPI0014726A5A|nr:keratinocyte-associated protein 3 [Thalassophryne amazonica]
MCTFDKDKGPNRLMKKGLALILVGHINLILCAIVHGNILRHISNPSHHITTEYTAVNVISVTSGLLSVTTGIVAIVVSRNLAASKLKTGLLIVSLLNALLSAVCLIMLIMAVGITVAHNGQGLMQGCIDAKFPINARSPISAECPFDTTRIYDTALTLWVTCAVMAAVETTLSVWCFIVGLILKGLACCGTRNKNQVEEEAKLSTHSQPLMRTETSLEV